MHGSNVIFWNSSMWDRTAVNLQALLKRVQKVQPAVVQKRVRAQKVLQAAA